MERLKERVIASFASAMARKVIRHLSELAQEHSVTHCHYFLDSATIIRNDLLRHPHRFNVVHLDSDHSYDTARAELAYFIGKLSGPTAYVLDDHDEHFPGVDRALRDFTGFTEVVHPMYDCGKPYGVAGFSAWLHTGTPVLSEGPRGGVRQRTRRWLGGLGGQHRST
jgi:hypothetical protein